MFYFKILKISQKLVLYKFFRNTNKTFLSCFILQGIFLVSEAFCILLLDVRCFAKKFFIKILNVFTFTLQLAPLGIPSSAPLHFHHPFPSSNEKFTILLICCFVLRVQFLIYFCPSD